MILNTNGRIVEEKWIQTKRLRKNVDLDAFVVMPNHVPGILFIKCRGALQYAPTSQITLRSPSQTIGSLVRGFKSFVTKHRNEQCHTPGHPVWQLGFHDHVIRHDEDVNHIRQYILNNPLKWALDKENHDHPEKSPSAEKPS